MIAGIGVDIVKVARIKKMAERYGERFAERLLTLDELADLTAKQAPATAQLLAKRFALKEAAMKALGTGFRNGIGWQQIGVGHDLLGRPLLQLSGAAQQRADLLGVCSSHITVSDEQEYVVGMVVLEAAPPSAP